MDVRLPLTPGGGLLFKPQTSSNPDTGILLLTQTNIIVILQMLLTHTLVAQMLVAQTRLSVF